MLAGPALAASFTSNQAGDWTLGATWNNPGDDVEGSGYPGPGDIASVGHDVDLGKNQTCSNLTVTANTLYCRGYDLTTVGPVELSGTLDAHTGGDPADVTLLTLDINVGGVYSATTNDTTLGDANNASATAFDNDGTFTHNNGRVVLVGAAYQYLDGSSATVFYDLRNTAQCRTRANVEFTVINLFAQTTTFRHADNLTINIGDSTHAGEWQCGQAATFRHGGNGDIARIIGKHPTQYAEITGADGWSFSQSVMTIGNIDYQYDTTIGNSFGSTTLEGDCQFTNLFVDHNYLNVQSYNLTCHNLTIDAEATNTVTSGTITVGGSFTNLGEFVCGTGTVVMGGAGNVDNNAQPFYNLTADAGTGNTVTLAGGGQVSAVSNQFHVASGTCSMADMLDKSTTGAGVWQLLGGGVTVMDCGLAPLVDAGATLQTGNPPPAGTIVVVR